MSIEKKWLAPVYKRLAKSELGKASHTSGIVPTRITTRYFGIPRLKKTHTINRISIEFWYENKSTFITTNVNYHEAETHQKQIHLSGNLFPTYKKFGAEQGDIVVFWRSADGDKLFKAELIKQNSSRWKQIKSRRHFPGSGGFIILDPPGKGIAAGFVGENQDEYQIPSSVELEFTVANFPPEKRRGKLVQKQTEAPLRSKIKGDFVLKMRNYKCEGNLSHNTFITPNGFPYMEKHHLIPMKYYDEFEYDLDDINNLISLCPVCHRKIHYGKTDEKVSLIESLWNKHKTDLEKSNLSIEISELKKKYSSE
ncbi:MAG: HNH endonuclease [bacterium]|nr:HNH endonuclease [bacterium]